MKTSQSTYYFQPSQLKYLKIFYLIFLSLFIISCGGGGGTTADVIPPIIQVVGENPVTIIQGSNYNDAGASASDNVDQQVTVTSSGSVSTAIIGTYIITYNAKDKAGNSAISKTRKVIVKASLTGIERIMQNAWLVERVKTKSVVNLQALATLKSGGIVDGFTTWNEHDNKHHITKRYAINNTGDFYIGAEGSKEAVLSVLTQKGISTAATWGYATAKNDVIHPDLNLDIRANALASSLYDNFVEFMDTTGIITSSSKLKLVYAKPYGKERGKAALNFENLEFGLQNKMKSTIKVLSSALIMRQMETRWACSGCPFNGTSFASSPWAETWHALNQKWNPKATDETNGSGTRSFNLQVTGNKIFYTAHVDGDNSNSGEISIDNNIVEAFSSWDADRHIYTRAGHAPSSVKMMLNNNWSVSDSTFRLAVLDGDITFSNMTQAPISGMSKNPQPLAMTIKTGWTIVEEKNQIVSFQFKKTTQKVTYGSDYNQACINEFGSNWHLADWNDLKQYFSSGKDMNKLITQIDLDPNSPNAWVTRNGEKSFSNGRDYFMTYHNHIKPSHYAAHDNIDNYFISLGSWYTDQNSLCIKP